MEWFALGLLLSPFFWFFFLLALAFFIACTELEAPGFAVVATILAFVALWYWKDINVLVVAWEQPWKVFLTMCGYLGLGILWSGYKWRVYNFDQAKLYHEAIENGYQNVKKEDYKPSRLNMTHKFFNWIVLWWASLIWYMCSRWLMDLVQAVVARMGWFYDRMAAAAWRD